MVTGHDLSPLPHRHHRRSPATRRDARQCCSGLIAFIAAGDRRSAARFKDDFTVPGIESQQAQDLLEERFPAQSGTAGHARVQPPTAGSIAASARSARRSPRSRASRTSSRSRTRSRRPAGCPRTAAPRTRRSSYDQTATELDARGARASRGRHRRPAALRRGRRDVRRADRRRGHRRVPGRRGRRPRDRGAAADRRPAQPARGGQRARRRLRRHRARASACSCGPPPRPTSPASRRRWPACSGSAPASTTRCCSRRASRRSCAPGTRRSRPPAAPT